MCSVFVISKVFSQLWRDWKPTKIEWLIAPACLLAPADYGTQSGHWLYNQKQETKSGFSILLVRCASSGKLTGLTISEICTTFAVSMQEASIPQSKNYHKISVPWWNKECALAVKNKKHAFNRMRRTRRSIDMLIFKRRRAVAGKVILAAEQQSWRNYYTAINSNTKLPMVWRTIKNFSGY